MTACQDTIDHAAVYAAGRSGFLSRVREVLAVWAERYQRRTELGQLLDMPEHLLRDMGVTREAVYREYRKPFWRP